MSLWGPDCCRASASGIAPSGWMAVNGLFATAAEAARSPIARTSARMPGTQQDAFPRGSTQCFEQRRVDLRRRAGDLAGLEIAALAAQVADQAAGLLDHQRARGHVPRGEAHLPERVEAAAGDVGEVERGCARAPDARALRHQ